MGLAEPALLCAFLLGNTLPESPEGARFSLDQNVSIEVMQQIHAEMNVIGFENHARILHEHVILSREVSSSFIIPVTQGHRYSKSGLGFHTGSHFFREEDGVSVPFIVTDYCGEGVMRPLFQPLYQCVVSYFVFSSATRVELAEIFAVTRDKVAYVFNLEIRFSVASGHGIKRANIVQDNIDPWSLAKSLQLIRFYGGVGSSGSFVSGLSSGDVGLPSEKQSTAKSEHTEQPYHELPPSQFHQIRSSLSHLPLLAQVGLALIFGGIAYGLIAYGAGFKPTKIWAVSAGFVLLALFGVVTAAP
jgi:hypothetical protein